MKHYDNTQQFYNGNDWADCKAQVIQERQKNGAIYCEHCGEIIVKGFNPNENNNKGAIVFHHITHLNNFNVNNANISINPSNIAILHWRCHNEVHNRFVGGYNKPDKKVYIVTGAPCSGKTSWVKERASANDLILDIDDIWETVSGQPRYTKPNCLKNLVFKLRAQVKDYIKTSAYDNWVNAYIIEQLPTAKERNDEADKYKMHNVEVITMDTTKQECIERLYSNPQGRNIKAYEEYINKYFENFIGELWK